MVEKMEIKSVPGNSFVEHFSFSSIIILGIYYCYVFFGQFFRIPSIILLFLGVFFILFFFTVGNFFSPNRNRIGEVNDRNVNAIQNVRVTKSN